MQLADILVSVCLAASVAAKGDRIGNSTDISQLSTKSQCKAMAQMAKIVDLAANDTKLQEKADGDAAKIDKIKAKAAEYQTQLTAMQANDTLASECAVVQAQDDSKDACQQMASWEKKIANAANDTKLQDKFEGNATAIDAYKAKASELQTKLAAMQGNSTLVSFCSAEADAKDCKKVAKLQKSLAMANNQTALSAQFEGNTTKMDKFKAKAGDWQAKLDAMMANTTLADTCAQLAQAGTTSSASTEPDASSPASPASKLDGRTARAGAALAFVAAIGYLAI